MERLLDLLSIRNRLEPKLLASLALVAGLLLLFGKLAEDVFDQDSHAFDRAILLALRNNSDLSQSVGPPWLINSVRDMTSLGGFTIITLVTVLSVLYLVAAGKYRNAALIALAMSLGAAAETGLKLLFSRARPDVVPHLVEVQTMSFPSGHAMMSAITYLTLGAMLARSQPNWRLRAFVFGCGVFLTLLIGISRIFLGVHWPTDVMAGWTVGSAWALIVWLIADYLNKNRRSQAPEE
ncbi:phosphatase PAP2 family protein [Rhizobium paknamense]|uniref:Undecaprenyl-diphosphatase n=1 Tax=Rhizobium paknamense TaxID=1206817 RepID=A0ABU0I6F6_9HYPH|nr:phosphatase PAP2 family protein [Rhizobium paknamense]MDQ0453793.1 undecaprenyl-diphosphatase [Rhizobium paknamense]